jgi:hypothetical protein
VPCPNPKLEDHPLLAVCDCLLYILAATLHIGGCSSVCNVRMRHAAETGTLFIMDGSTKLKLILQSSKMDWNGAVQYKAQGLQLLLLET